MPENVRLDLRAGIDQKAHRDPHVETSGRSATPSESFRGCVEAEITQAGTDTQSPNPALSGDVHQL